MNNKKIKTISIFTHLEGEAELLSQQETRNEQGYTIERIAYLPDGTPEHSFFYEYDNQNRLIKEVQVSDGKEICIIQFSYDESGRLNQEKQTYPEGGTLIKHFALDLATNTETLHTEDETSAANGNERRKFDADGRVLEEDIYDHDGKLTYSLRASYDDYGNPVWQTITDAMGKKHTDRFQYSRDEDGRLVSMKLFDEKGSLKREELFDYDAAGTRDYHEINDYHEGWGRIYEFVFNEAAQPEKMSVFDKDESPLSEIIYLYNEENLLDTEETTDRRGTIIKKIKYLFY